MPARPSPIRGRTAPSRGRRRWSLACLAVLASVAASLPSVASADGTAPTTPAQPVPTPPIPTQPIFVSGPPPGAVKLLDAVNSDEGQIVSLAAITEAHTLLGQARRARTGAVSRYDQSVGQWDAASLRLGAAQAAKLQAEGQVAFVEQALSQLGMAVYTGAATVPGSGLQAEETAEYHAELANVAATTTSGDLNQAQASLATDRSRLRVAQADVDRAGARVGSARAQLLAADTQFALSTRDVSITHKWALQTGTSPLYPTASLLRMEGPLGRAVLAQAREQERLLAASGTATVGPTTTGTTVPSGSEVGSRSSAPPVVAGLNLGVPQAPAVEGPSILGPSLLSDQEVLGWFESTGSQADVTTSIAQLVWDYFQAGRETGVRADIAFAQSIVETGHFGFPRGGQLTRKDNNFAGIGACDSCKTGWHFPSAMAGVLAQERLLQAYSTPVGVGANVSGMAGGVRGCCTTWLALSGTWATNPNYGYEILGIYKEMLDYAIPRTLLGDGLIGQAQFERDELELPAEDARTYALVSQAAQSSPVPLTSSCPGGERAGPSGTGGPTTTISTTTTTVAATTSSTAKAGAGGSNTVALACSSRPSGMPVRSATTSSTTTTATG